MRWQRWRLPRGAGRRASHKKQPGPTKAEAAKPRGWELQPCVRARMAHGCHWMQLCVFGGKGVIRPGPPVSSLSSHKTLPKTLIALLSLWQW